MNKPHVVILGAGASRAAFPHGDKNGKLLPLMKNFIDIVPVASLLKEAEIDFEGKNFEEIYSVLYQSGKDGIRSRIDALVYQYFEELEISDEPTLYDHLIISLREKDLIATFNWDPFLIKAIQRSPIHPKHLPHILFLHGNVFLGYCVKCNLDGIKGTNCIECGAELSPSSLLYPINKKNYTQDPLISHSWKQFQNSFKKAFIVTIFGYGAPQSDVEAIRLLKMAWGDKNKHKFERLEIIDVRPKEEVTESWRDFIYSHHYDVHSDFYDSSSWIANHPRRTGEAYISQNLGGNFIKNYPIPRNATFSDLGNWFDRHLTVEDEYRAKNNG